MSPARIMCFSQSYRGLPRLVCPSKLLSRRPRWLALLRPLCPPEIVLLRDGAAAPVEPDMADRVFLPELRAISAPCPHPQLKRQRASRHRAQEASTSCAAYLIWSPSGC